MKGIICIDKPAGITSFDVVAKLRKLTGERRAGHAGTLDPMATGVLPVFFGEATKAIPLLPCQDKRYTAGLRLGITTDTGDITGKTISSFEVNSKPEEVVAAALSLKGDIEQMPPMYSAIRLGGRHLYEIAREGREVKRATRPVTIYDIAVTGRDVESGDYTIEVSCSKGTYIRTICEDIGHNLGCGATMSSLRRTFAAGIEIGSCVSLEEVKKLAEKDKLQDIILKVEDIFKELPEIHVTQKQMVRFRNGGALSFERLEHPPESGICQVNCDGLLIGIGEIDSKLRQVNIKCHFNRDIE
jgi:tRNA pseudouridine55 synthase